jgi:V/A-type H+-transporting ATPase subunit I
MAGISFVGPKEEIERVGLRLLERGNFEPMSPEIMMEGRPLGARVRSFRSNRYDALLDRLEKLWIRAGAALPRKRLEGKFSQVSFSELEARVNEILETMSSWQRETERLEEEYEVWHAMLELSNALRETGRGMKSLARVPFGGFAVGTLTRDNWRRLLETSQASPFLAMPLIEEEPRITAVVFYGSDFQEGMSKIFSSVHMRVIPIQAEDGEEEPDATRYRLEALEAKIANYREMPARYIAENRLELEKLYSLIYAKQRIYTLAQKRGELTDMTILSGWIPRIDYEDIFRMAVREGPHTMIMVEYGDTLAERGVELPTLLRNLPLIRRFQEIVRLYSLPAYNELDPTFVVALSFCLFFGFMFGDVGHGLLLVLGTWFMEKKGLMGNVFSSVLKIAGMSAIFFGLLYGSIFGSEEILTPLWISPMRDVNTLLPVSVGVGVLFLTLGICFHIQNAARHGEWGEVIFSPEGLAGLLFYWMAVAQVMAVSLGLSEITFSTNVFILLAVGLVLVMIFGNGLAKYFFHGETVDEGGVVHGFSIFHAMLNFVSNTASFVRLAAFALNHVGLSTAVFMLAQMVEHAPGGRIYHVFVLLLGQMLIVGLEGLIVFIQTLRLEYYEFFGKFYQGGGREFAPVLWEKKDSAAA